VIPALLFPILFGGNPPEDPTGVGTTEYGVGPRIAIVWDVPDDLSLYANVYQDGVVFVSPAASAGSWESGMLLAEFLTYSWAVSFTKGGRESAVIPIDI
jgi:hypothetical protein